MSMESKTSRATLVAACVLLVLAGACRDAAAPDTDAAMPGALASVIDPVIDAAWDRFDPAAAQEHVEAIGPTWRLAGNASYDAALDRVRRRLADSGFDPTHLSFEEYDSGRPASVM